MKLITAVLMACAAAWAQGGFRLRDVSATSVELSEGGKPVFVYNHGMMLKEGMKEDRRRSSYVHPVWAPDGTVVTDDFPRDHPHHRGIFWAWPLVKVGGQTYDLWGIAGIHQRFVRWTTRQAKAREARLGVENGWFVGDRKVVKETVEVAAHPATGNRRVLEFTLAFEAVDGPVELTGESTSKKGYGGFGVRFGPRARTVLTTDTGNEAKDTNMAPHPWAQLEGEFAGRRAGVRVDIDHGNPGFPNGWCLRHYGYLGVNFPGFETYRLEPGKPLKMKYRVTLLGK
jgi:hypothetical protein